MTKRILLFAALSSYAVSAAAWQWVPIFDSTLMMGQLYQNGTASSWEGNGSFQATPAAKVNESLALIPTYAFNYQGTKMVTDLGSGGQLFQDSMSHAFLAKGVWKSGDWRWKPQLGWRWEMLRETKEEKWTKGLFDYQKPSAGVEAEYSFAERSAATFSFDYYGIRFPNYSSLESAVVSQGLGREQAQARTLDSQSLSGTVGVNFAFPIPDTTAKLAVNWTRRAYPHQSLVLANGDLDSGLRVDEIKMVSGSLTWGHRYSEEVGLMVALQTSWTRLDSNQNHYDAAATVYGPNYYSYEERQIQPRATAVLGTRGVELSIAYLSDYRRYVSRLAQDASGTYFGDTEYLNQDNVSFDIAVPLGKNWKARASATIATATSNDRYEAFFKANYTLQNYLIGASYTY